MFIIFDTETTGLPKNYNAPVSDSDNWPRLVQLAWQIHDVKGDLIEVKNYIIKPDSFEIPYATEKIHGISTERALRQGVDLSFVLEEFNKSLAKSSFTVGHNVNFDINIVGAEFHRKGIKTPLMGFDSIDTKSDATTEYCALPGGKGGNYKWPTLTELHTKLFDEGFGEAHNASADVEATARCFLELIRLGVITTAVLKQKPSFLDEFRANNPDIIQAIGLNIQPYNPNDIEDGGEIETRTNEIIDLTDDENVDISTINYSHLHVHTQYSILDGAAEIPGLIKKAAEDNMSAIAITDHGNMFGVKLFHQMATKNGIKPILGCEAYVARRSMDSKADKHDAGGYHLILLAKNLEGYHNLMKIVSYSWLEGYYYKPRTDKEQLRKHSKGLIALSACLGGEIPKKITEESEEAAEASLLEYKEIFGEDFFLELQRHPSEDPQLYKEVYEDQMFVNRALIKLGKKCGVKCVATNDVHFINADDAAAHDRLICLSTGKDLDDPNRMKYTRQEWFKTQDEMKELWKDYPQALANTQDVVDRVESFSLDVDPIMPDFVLPEDFDDEDEYLKHITYEGAYMRWGKDDVTPEIKERIDFELETIKKMGFPGYFLIVWDFLKAARDMGVSVGPGRGSAAGSAVAYSLRITEIDPIKYNLLFERFLNPDRISMPDIDIDFDEDGRSKILEWVVNKYGAKRVAHIITFGTMAPKMSIRDVARVQKLPLPEADRLAKLIPERPGTSFAKAFEEVPELCDERDKGAEEVSSVLQYAQVLEGSVRNTGTHACGIIIGKDDLEKYVPISTAKDSELTYVTQYDGKHVENIGLLKMDFLGLKTLSIIKDAVENVKLSKGIDVDIENVDLEDEKTYELYSRGETTGLFQFESDGMKKYLKELKPTRFEDLIAMNALYRPGPMEYIPQFIARKHGREKIEYDLPVMEDQLKETYGITVYQEQVMLLSRTMAGFTRGQSDSLRKAMGKKIKAMMDDLKVKFVEGCENNNLDTKKVEKVWRDWENFAKYAFNKSHATCYSYVSYQTAYMKAHYPGEFMAAVLSRNLNDIKKITFFIEECQRMGLKVLGPDVNESHARFTVNKKGEIRFGLAAIKGVGEAAVEEIINERTENGEYANLFDLVKRVGLRTVNKKSLEALAMGGAFDNFVGVHRAQLFFRNTERETTFLEKIVKFGNQFQEQKFSAQVSLFGESQEVDLPEIPAPKCEAYTKLQLINQEKEVTGFYISGHPLDEYKLVIDRYCTHPISTLKDDLAPLKGKPITFAGIVTVAAHRQTKNGKPFGTLLVEDFSESINLMLFSEDYGKNQMYFVQGSYLLINATVRARFNNPDNLELKVNSICFLDEVLDKRTKEVEVEFSTTEIDEPLIEKLSSAVEEFKGACKLSIKVVDPDESIQVPMRSRSKRVDPNKFIQFIESLGKGSYKLIS
ncbi:MAG: DNA polymerase III subunit alpha [Hyphomicrobiales bacterium]